MNDFGLELLPSYLERVDEILGKSTKVTDPALQAAILRFINSRGKRIRPSLVTAIVAHSGNKVDNSVVCGAAAIELVHIGSLVHDDIMDEGMVRRGIPTINHKEGIDTAILAGDYFLAKACALASLVSGGAGVLIAETIVKMSEGQSMELADKFNTERSVKSLMQVIKGKTASLYSAACQLGGFLAKLDEAQVAALATYGENFGMAFQILDDVEDFTQTEQSAGKSVGKDVAEGVYTLPLLLSLQGPHKSVLKKVLVDRKTSNADVVDILKRDGTLEGSLKEANKYFDRACLSLHTIQSKQLVSVLENFASKYKKRV